MSLLRIWHHRNLWRHRALNRNDSKRQQNRLESFIITNSGQHNDQTLDFKTNNSHRGCVHYFLLSGQHILLNSRLGNSRLRTGLQCQIWRRVHGACSQPFAHQGPYSTGWISWIVLFQQLTFKFFSDTVKYWHNVVISWNAVICSFQRLGYRIFTNANEKFINVFVKAFTKSDATEPQFGESSYRLKKVSHAS